MSLWENIPEELRSLPHWVVADDAGKPFDPKSGRAASVIDPSTWGTFEQACSAAKTAGRLIGLVLTDADPYTGIDLDDKLDRPATDEQRSRHQKIVDMFDSYTERSRSGRGYHIIAKGRVLAALHRDNVEVYSERHYFIMTGDVVRDVPIAERQDLLSQLVHEMKPAPTVDLLDGPEVMDDKDLVDMAMNAANGAKFTSLCNGEWQGLGYPSQSEADFALLSILAFYTRDNEQVRRLFRMSNLGKREKHAKDDRLINAALRKIRAQQPPPVDVSELRLEPVPEPVAVPEELPAIALPPGLVGDLALYIYQSAIRPVPEVALAAAFALVAGVGGRQFNTAGLAAGLNSYLISLGKTGIGKEAAKDGIDRVLAAVRLQVPAVMDFVGPGTFASGQALMRVLEKKSCFFSVLGEIGHTLIQITRPNAHGYETTLLKVLLDLWSRSGRGKTIGAMAYSDVEKSTLIVHSPSVTILGDATPDVFFGSMDESHIASGLLPRFQVIDYQGDRPDRNVNAGFEPPQGLVDRFATLVQVILQMQQNDTFKQVPLDAAAIDILDAFDHEADAAIRAANGDVQRQVWNRAHLNALKDASLIAVGADPFHPQVTAEHARWAVEFVRRCVRNLLRRFEKGEVGGGDNAKAEAAIRKYVEAFHKMTPEQRASPHLKIPDSMRATGQFVPYAYLREKTKGVQPFKQKDWMLKNTLEELVKAGVLAKLTDVQAREKCRSRGGDVYTVGPNWRA